MPRVLMRLMGIGILVFGLIIGTVLMIGRILPTRQLAYVAVRHTRSDLILLDLYHRIQVNLIPAAYMPSWSPDGEQIAFYAAEDNGIRNLYILDVFTHHIRRLTKNGASNIDPSWSPDGHEIAFASDYDNANGIFVISVDCTDSFEQCATRLTPKDTYFYGQPAWSPDGERIAFVSTQNTTSADPLGNDDIFVMNRDGSELHRLTENPNDDYSPSWSPDSRQIVYSAQNLLFGTTSIMIMDTNCSPDLNCIRPLFGDNFVLMPAWSPDGNSIVFVNARDDSNEIYLTDTQGHYLQRLTNDDANKITPRWRP